MNRTGKTLVMVLVVLMHSSVLLSCNIREVKKPPPTQVKVIPENSDEREIKFTGTGGNGLACQDHYIGIGVLVNWGSMQVQEVAPGGPADQAGVRVGDILLRDDPYGMLEKGTKVEVPVERDGKKLILKATIGEVCYEQ